MVTKAETGVDPPKGSKHLETEMKSAVGLSPDVFKTPERELVARGQLGDSSAMGELFSRNYQKSLRIANRILASRQDSEDAVQNAYCSAFEHIGTFRNDASFGTWVTRIVVNSCQETIRKPFRRMLPISNEVLQSLTYPKGETLGRSPEAFTSDRQVGAAVNLALSRLPPQLLLPFKLFSYSEMSVAEVAAALNVSVAAAKSRIYRARLELRQALNGMWR